MPEKTLFRITIIFIGLKCLKLFNTSQSLETEVFSRYFKKNEAPKRTLKLMRYNCPKFDGKGYAQELIICSERKQYTCTGGATEAPESLFHDVVPGGGGLMQIGRAHV